MTTIAAASGQRDHRVKPVGTGDLHEDQPDHDSARSQRVGPQVRRVAGQRGRVRAPRVAIEDRRHDEVDRDRHACDRDAEADELKLGVVGQMADRLERNRGRPDHDQDPLDRRGQVLDLLVAVAMAIVGRGVGLAYRDECDHRGDEVDARMHGLGQDRHRPGDRTGDHLEQDQRRVRDDRQRRRAQLLARNGWVRGAHVFSHSTSARIALPRWLMASFSSSESSAMVRFSRSSSGMNAGS